MRIKRYIFRPAAILLCLLPAPFARAQYAGGIPGDFMHSLGDGPLQRQWLNPACYALPDRQELRLTDNLLPGGNHLAGLAYVLPLSALGTAAAGAVILHEGTITARDAFDRELGRFGQGCYVFTAAYAHRLLDQLRAGAAIKTVIARSALPDGAGLEQTHGWGYGLDLGLDLQLNRYLRCGIGYANAGFRQGGSAAVSDPWPGTIAWHADYRTLDGRLTLSFDAGMFDLDTDGRLFAGTEPAVTVKPRYGLTYRCAPGLSLTASGDTRSYALGLTYAWNRSGDTRPSVDAGYAAGYHYRTGYLRNRFDLAAGWGAYRKGRENIPLADPEKRQALAAFARAKKLYDRGKYPAAADAFGRDLALFKAHGLGDRALYYFGSACSRLSLYHTAGLAYQRLRREYPASGWYPYTLAAEVTDAYRTGRDAAALETYLLLQERTGKGMAFPEADYHAGQVLQRAGRYAEAAACFVLVPVSHPYHAYAQFSLAQCALFTGDADSARACLARVVDYRTDAAGALSQRASLTAGYLSYELRDFSAAAARFRMVPAHSRYYPDALLGLAWCALGRKKYAAADSLAALVPADAEDPLVIESGILQGYVRILLKDHEGAAVILDTTLRRSRNRLARAAADSLSYRRAAREAALQAQAREITELDAVFADAYLLQEHPGLPARALRQRVLELGMARTAVRNARSTLAVLDRSMRDNARITVLAEEAEYALLFARRLQAVRSRREKLEWYDTLLKEKEQQLLDRLNTAPQPDVSE